MARTVKDWIKASFGFPLCFLLIIWIIHIGQESLGVSLGSWGILPRHPEGALGILTAPLVHGDFQHLISNSLPALMLLVLLFSFYRPIAYWAFIMIYILTGAMVWIFARGNFHIGASGVVYGLVSFIFWSGLFRRSTRSIVLALIVLFLYSGYFMGIVPQDGRISWESHLFGALMGIFVAYVFRSSIVSREDDQMDDQPPQDKQPYFDADTFSRESM